MYFFSADALVDAVRHIEVRKYPSIGQYRPAVALQPKNPSLGSMKPRRVIVASFVVEQNIELPAGRAEGIAYLPTINNQHQ